MRFAWWGQSLELVDEPYNSTILNERAVEVAVARHWLTKVHGAGLEVGHVMSHYGLTRRRLIVDLHDPDPRCRNIDVLDIEGSFDWILAISTIEHVHWDTTPRDPDASLRAIHHLQSCLTDKGRMLVTVPTGWQPHLDAALAEAGAVRACTIARDGLGWQQSPDITIEPYGATTAWAESVWIGEYEGRTDA